jgi:TldD protein
MRRTDHLSWEDHFGLSRKDMSSILETALSKGALFAEVFCEHRFRTSIHMEEDIIQETGESISRGLGIRVISGDRTGYGYTNDPTPERIRAAALTAAAVASGRLKPGPPAPLRRVRTRPGIYGAGRPAHAASLSAKIGLVRIVHDAARFFSSEIRKVSVSFQNSLQYVSIANSEGLEARDVRPLVRLTCTAIAEKNGRREIGFSGGGGRLGLEAFGSGGREAAGIGRDAAREALILLDAVDAPAGDMPVVLAPGHSGVLIHEAVGHLLEADFNRKKTSVFWNKLGKSVAPAAVTIRDDPTIPFFRGSYAVDDEGTIPRRTTLIEKGVVVGFLQDRLSARLMKRPPTGHGRRQDYGCFPLPRMANSYIERGEYAPEEILKSVGRGFYVDKIQGGQVEDSGKFTFSVSLGYLIENGRLGAPVRQATLIGSNLDVLKGLVMVGSDLEFGLPTGTCSKEGQDVPVTDGCPTLKIASITVGGR